VLETIKRSSSFWSMPQKSVYHSWSGDDRFGASRNVKFHMAAPAAPQTWMPTIQNRIVFPEMQVMHGGPIGMRLPEHEHAEIQVGMHFVSPQVSQKPQVISDYPSYFSLIPSGKPHVGQWRNGSEVVVTLLSKTQVERASDELLRSSSSQMLSAPCAVDPVILSLGSVLRREFLSGGIADPFFVEAIGTVLAGHLVRRWSSLPRHRSTKGTLSPSQLRQTLDAIDSWMPSGIRIKMLADQLGMGTHQFTRHFRQSIGCSPYRFVIQRRIERARLLLEESSLPLAEIALELGFVSQSHFTSVFRRELRTTPQSYRSLFLKSNCGRLSD
jgi:AraC family transcriptional regulator